MIEIDELRIKQAEFEVKRQEYKKVLEKLEAERKLFLKEFPESKIKDLTLEEYVIGKGSKNSFCYWLEDRLKGLGRIHGATAFKFGIYFGEVESDSTSKYRFTSKFGENSDEAFENVKKTIVNLFESAKKGDIDEIRTNILSPMFKGKILSTYYPEKFLNIFANEHLEYLMSKLDIAFIESSDEIEKRKILIDFKNKDEVMSKWSIYEFSKFLYESFGRPPNPRREGIPEALKEYIESNKYYPKINDVKSEFIDLKINPENIEVKKGEARTFKKTIDFERENKINKRLGNRGEEVVFNLEKDHLKSLDKKELASKVEWASKDNDSLGYDIVSFEEDGKEKFIEVKSTTQSYKTNANFLISNNQYEKARSIKNYYFYIVFDAKSKNPKVWSIKNPLNYENKGLTLTPVNYRVIINTSD